MSLYDRLGGEPAVAALLDGLYARALADSLLQPFLKNVDVARLQAHQYAFISQALGGPHQYSGPSLAAAHSQLQIANRHFDAFVEHLRGALSDLGAPNELTREILSRVTPLHPVVVNTPTVGS